jgi:hypothetical protein
MLRLRLVLVEIFEVWRMPDPLCCLLMWLGLDSEKNRNLIVCGCHLCLCKGLSTSIEKHVKTMSKG